MARSRNIKPSIMDNEVLAAFSAETRLLFIYTWMLADREGRLEDRPARIKVQAFPYGTEAEIEKMLDQLAGAGFLIRYEVAGQRLIQIVNFAKHQSPHVREKASELPDPGQGSAKAVPSTNQGSAMALPRSPDSLIPDSLIPDSDKTTTPTKVGLAAPEPAGFQRFWDNWPKSARKVDRKKCLAKWNAAKLEQHAGMIVQHVERMKVSKQWLDGYEPAPLTYLSGERWNDDPVDGTASKASWWHRAGFPTFGDAENAGCRVHNADQFCDGKRIAEATA